MIHSISKSGGERYISEDSGRFGNARAGKAIRLAMIHGGESAEHKPPTEVNRKRRSRCCWRIHKTDADPH